jgi:ribosome recycling factor
MSVTLVNSAKDKMEKSLALLKDDLQKVRTGRASPSLLDHLTIDYYGTQTPLNQVANITTSDARTIIVVPWEKNLISAVEKVIRDSDLGLNPATLGDQIRVPMPPLTEERRKEFIKLVRKTGEGAKVAIRNVRRDTNSELKNLLKAKEISEDEERKTQDEIQKITDRCVSEVDRLLSAKEADLMDI